MKEKILVCAQNMIKAGGVAGASINKICEECGISRVTFYKYFKSKNELVNRIVSNIFAKWNKEVEEAFFGEMSFEEKLEFLILFKERQTAEAGHAFSKELMSPPPLIAAAVQEQKLFAMRQFERFLNREREKGTIDPRMPNEFIMLLAQYLGSFARDERMNQVFDSEEKKMAAVLAVLLKGIRA